MKSKVKPNIMKTIGNYAGARRHLITLGRILAAVSALMGLVPFYLLWKIIRIAVNGEDLMQIEKLGWLAVSITVTALLVYIAALLCTHMAAFRVQANLIITDEEWEPICVGNFGGKRCQNCEQTAVCVYAQI